MSDLVEYLCDNFTAKGWESFECYRKTSVDELLAVKDAQIAELKAEIKKLKKENARLNTELDGIINRWHGMGV